MKSFWRWFIQGWDGKFGVVGIGCAIFFVGWAGTRTYYGVEFDATVESRLSLASTAFDPELAAEELDAAITEIERRGLTQGRTSLFFDDPREDLGLWYARLTEARDQLRSARARSPEQVAIIMVNLRDAEVYKRVPVGVSIFGMNRLFFWWGMLSGLFPLLLLVVSLVFDDLLNEWERDTYVPA